MARRPRRRGRPPVPPGERRTVNLQLSVTQAEADAIRKYRDEDNAANVAAAARKLILLALQQRADAKKQRESCI